MNTWYYALTSVSLISAASLTAVFAFYLSSRSLDRLMFVLVSVATGAMLGNALIHLVPESFEYVETGVRSSITVSVLMLAGYLASMGLHKGLNLHRHRTGRRFYGDETENSDTVSGVSLLEPERHEHGMIHPNGHMTIQSHAMDNFNDGILIGIAFLNGVPSGIAMTVAIILHEIPMELGGFGILVQSGISKGKAVLINFLSGIVAMTGTALVLGIGGTVKTLPSILTPVGAGVVIYLAASGLIPQFQKEHDTRRSLAQIAFLLLGAAIMIACKLVEG